MVVENYPNLKSNESFNKLMDEIAGTENRIAVERQKYNTQAQVFNTLVQRVPTNILASLFNFQVVPYYEVAEEDKQVPKVQF